MYGPESQLTMSTLIFGCVEPLTSEIGFPRQLPQGHNCSCAPSADGAHAPDHFLRTKEIAHLLIAPFQDNIWFFFSAILIILLISVTLIVRKHALSNITWLIHMKYIKLNKSDCPKMRHHNTKLKSLAMCLTQRLTLSVLYLT